MNIKEQDAEQVLLKYKTPFLNYVEGSIQKIEHLYEKKQKQDAKKLEDQLNEFERRKKILDESNKIENERVSSVMM